MGIIRDYTFGKRKMNLKEKKLSIEIFFFPADKSFIPLSLFFLLPTAEPQFVTRPTAQRVGLNGIAKFDCAADGNPPPSVFWTKEGSQDLMFPGTSHGTFHVSPTGTLTIQGVKVEDEGFFVCSALSVAGSLATKAYLAVTALEDEPPPIIRSGGFPELSQAFQGFRKFFLEISFEVF